MKLTVLGSGSPEAYARRASSGHLLEVAGQRILFDCGGGAMDRLLQAGFSPSDVDVLFFSHLHSDHMMDYARLVHARWDEGGPPLKVFGPAPLAQITGRYFGPEGALAHDLVARTEFLPSQEVWRARGGEMPRPWPAPQVTEITPGYAHSGAGWELTSCPVPHAQPFLTCMAYRVAAEGKSFVYSGDAGPTGLFERFCQGADLLLHWCYRLSGEEVTEEMARLATTPAEIAEFAQRAEVRQLVLTHFRVHMDAPGAHETAKAEMAANFSGPAAIAEDLDTFDI